MCCTARNTVKGDGPAKTGSGTSRILPGDALARNVSTVMRIADIHGSIRPESTFPSGGFRRATAGLFAAFCCLMAATDANSADTCVRTVHWTQQPPYQFAGPNGDVQGISPELVAAVLSRMNCAARYIEMPFPRAIVELEDGRLDILIGVAHTAERERIAHFSPPIERHPNALFVNTAAVKKYALRQLADIRGTDFRLGHQLNLSYGAEYEALKRDPAFAARLNPVANRLAAWKMLAAGRIDGVIADLETGQEEIAREGLQQFITTSTVPLVTTPSFIAMSRKAVTPDFAAHFNQTLATLIDSGELARIFERHGRCSSVGPRRPCPRPH